MSDILEKLLGVEKSASVLITEAESEANRRKTTARLDAQKRYTQLLADKAAELDLRLEEARKRLAGERDEQIRSYSESLKKRKLDTETFHQAVITGIGKAQ
jgi:vacuolar-type H+-ATPase subunit H